MATEDLSTAEGWEAFKARHQGEVGSGIATQTVDDNGRRLGPDGVYYKYTMKDGTTIEINGKGQVKSIDEKAPSQATGTAPPSAGSQAAPTTKDYTVTNQDGSTDTYIYQWDPAQKTWTKSNDIPPEHKPAPAGAASSKPPTDVSQWVPIHANPQDPSSPIIALQDPQNSGNRVTVPQGTTPARPTTVQGPNNSIYSWDGSTLKELLPATPDKRQIVQGAGGALYSWDGKTLDTVKAGDQPKNGDTMQDVDAKGNQITRTYQNGQWGTTAVGQSLLPGAPKEGQTRQVIQNNYNTTQTYQNGEWTTTAIGSKAVPTAPTQLTGSSDTPYQQFMDTSGNITTQDNPNYQPKTAAQVAARIGQIQQLAQQQRDAVQAKIGQNGYTAQNALDEFNAWWDKNVAPQQASLQAAQDDVAFQRAKDQAAMRTSAMNTAISAGNQQTTAFDAMQRANPVQPGYAQVINQIAGNIKGMPKNVGDMITWQGPNPMDAATQGTMNALKYIDPTAAAATGAPPPNLNSPAFANALDRTQYLPGGGPPAPGGPPPTLPGPPPGPLVSSQPYETADQSMARQQAALAMPPWLRADQMNGFAPPGNAMAAPGVAGTVAPGAPQYLGWPNPWDQTQYQFGGE